MTSPEGPTQRCPSGRRGGVGAVPVVLVVAGLVVGACGGDDTAADDAETATEAETTINVEIASDPSAATGAEVDLDATFKLTFDGSECVADGPAEVSPGVVTTYLVNESDELVHTALRRLDDGYTFQDMVDGMEGEWFGSRDDWVHEVPQLASTLPEGVKLPLGDTHFTWLVGVETAPGQHEIHLWNWDDLWPCTGLIVTDE